MIQGFFFDMDGTLVDTHRANFEAYRKAIKDVSGTEITWEQFKATIGHVAKTFLPWFIPDAKPEVYARIAALKAEYYKDFLHMTKANVALISFMELMKDNKIALVTTAKRRNAESVLKQHGLSHHFDCIITQEDVESTKPAPDAYTLALQKTGLMSEEVIAFEDSDSGRAAAEAAGIRVVMINTFSL